MKHCEKSALIVEEQPFVGLVASDILGESGIRTFHAFDAPEATRQLEAHPEIGLLFVGAVLPSGANGIEFAASIARARPDVQLVITAERGHEPVEALPTGARLLRKPFASGELRLLAAVD